MLAREARAALAGQPYPHRVIVGDSGLTLLLRRRPDDRLPDHVVWLDATANPRLYQACFGRKAEVVDAQPRLMGRIFQVTDRANGHAALQSKNKRGEASKAEQMKALVLHIVEDYGYQNPAVTSYDDVIRSVEAFRAMPHVHFFAGRGTNALEGVDALFVAGTPQPPLEQLEHMATMLFWERMTAFACTFLTRPVQYNYIDPQDGQGRQYPVAGFWNDLDLQSVLWSKREAEIIQMAHRCRPALYPVDIWLLSNIPIDELPPFRLLDMQEVMGAPKGANVFTWAKVLEIAERCDQERGAVTSVDLTRDLGIDGHTARRYVQYLIDWYGWYPETAAAKRSGGGGRRAAGATKRESHI